MRHAFHNVYKSAAEMVLPVRTSSAFKEKGVLTPEEFVAAGDFLVSTCPTWSWESGEPSKKRAYLPADKQFLVTRNIPCTCRAKDLLKGKMEEELVEGKGEDDGDAWVATGGGNAPGEEEAIEDMSLNDEVTAKLSLGDSTKDDDVANDGANNGGDDDDDDDDDVPDMEDFVVEEEDDTVTIHPRAVSNENQTESKILKTRTYDISVTYDKYYQTPRFWLIGYDESRQLLKPELALEDVSAEHAEKTVTIDMHPHLPLSSASIHPCKHAHVMKRLLDNLEGGKEEPSVEHYLVIFLKFIASIVPTIDYDYTMAAR